MADATRRRADAVIARAMSCIDPVDLAGVGALFDAPAPPPAANADVVELIENMLAIAKSGRLRAVAIAAATDEGGTSTAWAGEAGTTAPLILALDRVRLRLLDVPEMPRTSGPDASGES